MHADMMLTWRAMARTQADGRFFYRAGVGINTIGN
jgi:hypothetical protein